ncbi:MAG: CoA-binding protein [Bacillati bacterium ANGP1]|uniref:CoA-binding protein n=1 Tax=Candidatus Segetimicrobium genomatis TaxID=2569760 RepID=A0A537LXQ3_9BACT|nr:MAG: CoA-binding protein [Terrabacteria group bacterium ANGP1]
MDPRPAVARVTAPARDLSSIFAPRSVAVIGASRDPGKVGHAIFRNVLEDFQGVVYPVNPHAQAIRGVRSYPSVQEIPDPLDLAIIIVPAASVRAVLDECGRKGVRGVVVISAGFRESGPQGRHRESEVVAAVQQYGFALVGPNCLGVLNTDPAVRLNATFARAMPAAGSIAFLSQSGALTTAVLDYARARGIGFSKLVSLGNKADVTELDLLAALRDDPRTDVILLYLEELADGQRFIGLCREITGEIAQPKPILAVKSGRTPAGARAVSSHTGSLAGSDEVYDAVFLQSGVLRVDSVEELFHYAVAFANQPLPSGRRVAIVTNAGGPGIMAADAAVRQGLELAAFAEGTKQALRLSLPAEAAIDNPVDVVGDAQHDRYQAALRAVLRDPGADGAIVVLTPQAVTDIEQIARVVAEEARGAPRHPAQGSALHHAAQGSGRKPVLASFMGLVDVSAGVRVLEEARIPHYGFPEDAVRAFAAMTRYAEWVHRPRTEVRQFSVDRAAASDVLRRSPRGVFVRETMALRLIEAYGFPMAPWAEASSAEEAVIRASAIGFPVAIKVLSPQIVHKVDVGGIRLDLTAPSEVRAAYEEMMADIARRLPGAAVEGVLVQKMVPGVETILGINRDPQFGPILMFGLGGIYVEVFRDVTFRLAPIRELGAQRMVESIKAGQILRGVRGRPPADVEALLECIERLSQLAVEIPEIAELDINPLMVLPAGQGAAVVDARLRLLEEGVRGQGSGAGKNTGTADT